MGLVRSLPTKYQLLWLREEMGNFCFKTLFAAKCHFAPVVLVQPIRRLERLPKPVCNNLSRLNRLWLQASDNHIRAMER